MRNRDSALNAPSNAITVAVARPVKTRDRKSHEACTVDTQPFLLGESRAWQAVMMKEDYTTCSNRVDMNVRKLSTATRALRCTYAVSVGKREDGSPDEHSTFESLIRDLHTLRGRHYRRSINLKNVKTTLPVGISNSRSGEYKAPLSSHCHLAAASPDPRKRRTCRKFETNFFNIIYFARSGG